MVEANQTTHQNDTHNLAMNRQKHTSLFQHLVVSCLPVCTRNLPKKQKSFRSGELYLYSLCAVIHLRYFFLYLYGFNVF